MDEHDSSDSLDGIARKRNSGVSHHLYSVGTNVQVAATADLFSPPMEAQAQIWDRRRYPGIQAELDERPVFRECARRQRAFSTTREKSRRDRDRRMYTREEPRESPCALADPEPGNKARRGVAARFRRREDGGALHPL